MMSEITKPFVVQYNGRMITDKREILTFGWGTEYDRCYSLLDVRNKVVIDVGADFGSSPLYFHEHGASHVYAYEKNPDYLNAMRYYLGDEPWLTINGEWNGELPDGDVFKIDIEGGEALLSTEIFQKYPQWCIALHPSWLEEKKYRELLEATVKHKGTLVYVTDDMKERMYVSSTTPWYVPSHKL